MYFQTLNSYMNKNMVFKLWFLLVSKFLNTKT
jgi:hypothetical protein